MDGNGRETFVIYLVLAGEGLRGEGEGRMQCALSRPSSLIQTLNRVGQNKMLKSIKIYTQSIQSVCYPTWYNCYICSKVKLSFTLNI